ncbi:DNA-directed DNA polymerase [Exophiala xenobiotica]|uniref:DNA-directed DNA polymerase n=1 Tax=Lithohypha guttulata TaxID=1690604 RepID=A0ABR0KPX1_9EURO|nr:DNA-directed DNA polymerase [Lithohypha guttulata]KAK5330627.1 DNA-directed DNA polymerase [Exophiala xenobiotica]
MSVKRARLSDSATNAPSKRPKVDPRLAKIWEDLANDDLEVRLHASYDLVTKHCTSNDLENAKLVARRLFRGLCSSRKSARLGFYLALVGALSTRGSPFGTTELSLADIISLLEHQTTPELGTSGQDERDHYFGRLLACKAIFETNILAGSGVGPESAWSKVFGIICSLMAQKPWLRSEGASIICSAISQAASIPAYSSSDRSEAVSQAFKHLKQHKLARTIDGVGIWLYLQEDLPEARLPHDVWASNDPLSSKELPMLKKALLDSQSSGDDGQDVLGTSIWSQKPHDAWKLVLRRLGRSQSKAQVPLTEFWQVVVDDGLFLPSASPERKFIGFHVLGIALKEVSSSFIPPLFTKNLMVTMIQALKSPDTAYLRKVVSNVFSEFRDSQGTEAVAKAEAVIEGLLVGSDFADFDTLTKTDTITSLFELVTLRDADLGKRLISWLQHDPKDDKDLAKIASHRKNILNLLQRTLCRSIRGWPQAESTGHTERDGVLNMVKALLHLKQIAQKQDRLSLPYDEGTYAVLNERVQQILETLLAVPSLFGQPIFLEVVAQLETVDLQAEASIHDTVKVSWKHFSKLQSIVLKQISSSRTSKVEARKPTRTTFEQGLALLLATLVYEVYDGEGESAEMLEDVNSMAEDVLAKADENKVADHMIDIVLSFMSRASKFHRRVGGLVFEAFAAQMSKEGLRSLTDILKSKEGREGQEELFENGDLDFGGAETGDDSFSSEASSIDSDVEVLDGADEKNGTGDSESEPSLDQDDEGSQGGSDDEGSEDEELTKFESALATALGTRKLNEDDLEDAEIEGDSDSDSDMSDSRMMELDSKLAEVFRNQQNESSAQKVRKEEMKSARENVVNLKNRAIDLIDLFLRSQQARGMECVELLDALLQVARTTGTQQLANRATEAVRNYGQKTKGAKLPKVQPNKETREVLLHQLEEVHKTVMQKDTSNALIDTAGQMNILLCKLLIEAGEKDVKEVVKAVSSEAGSRTEVKRRAMQDFWSRYDAWTNSLEQKEMAVQKSQRGASKKGEKKQQIAPQAKPKDNKKKKAQTAA